MKLKFNSLAHSHLTKSEQDDIDHFWLEVEIDGVPVRIDFGKQEGSERNSVHINASAWLEVDHHSVNALDIYVKETKRGYSAQVILVRDGNVMRGKCPCQQVELSFKIVLEEDFVGNRVNRITQVRLLDQPAVQWSFCEACKCDVQAQALPGSGLYSLLRRPRRENPRT